jgi:dTDP-4-amino-4,6-dideoxygalactose transaminase
VKTLHHREIAIAAPAIGEEEWRALREPLESGWLTSGPKVTAFEQAFAARHRVRHAIATTSCTTGLHLALAAAGVGPGDEVVVPAFTWVATANAVLYCGARPVFVDVDPLTYNMRPDAAAAAMTGRTRAVIPVHLFGLCADVDEVQSAVPGAIVIEDAACASGASYKGRPAGGLGDAAVFSFHPRKTITTGEGGMVTTNDAALAARAACLRNHGATVPEEVRHGGHAPYVLPDFEVLGFNYRMTDLQAALGLVQLSKLDDFIDERRQRAGWYASALADLDWLQLPTAPAGYGHGWQSYVAVMRADAGRDREDVMRRLQEAGIATRPGTHAVPDLGLYRRRADLRPEGYPVAAELSRRSIALPLHNRMDERDFEYVADVLHRV